MRYRRHGWGADSLVARYGCDVLGRRIARRVYWLPLPGAEARETRYLYQGGQAEAPPLPAGPRSFPIAWPPNRRTAQPPNISAASGAWSSGTGRG
ncbi:MAG: hypothetical protein KA180_05625 [Gemmatimonadales bacterium]|nr:hypothetical protein [Gemmatimonadales bacterium]